jgi:hypothetical protein
VEAYPLVGINKAMSKVLQLLDDFKWEDLPNVCEICNKDPTNAVRHTQGKLKSEFDGLCLDCMDKHKSKTGDQHSDYWLHNRIQDWDKGCRIKHGQCTWYYSFMGRTRLDGKKRFHKQILA